MGASERTNREIHLRSRPHGAPTTDDFELVEAPVPEPGDGQVLVRNEFLSVDPYMRGRMNDVKSYAPPFALGQVMDGGAVGQVVASRSAQISEGAHVVHRLGWREWAVGDADGFQPIEVADGESLSAHLGALGMPGLTAYAGLVEVAPLAQGEAVFVSGAAGAVGSMAGQIARQRGASRVVGSAGSAEKVAYLLDELGFDAAFNYKDGPVGEQLREAAPDGIDVYFDNVGGDHLEAALVAARPFGRIALCGAISLYNATEPQPGPRNLTLAIGKQLTLRGYLVGAHLHLRDEFLRDVRAWLASGQVRFPETVIDGIEHMPEAFIGMLGGQNLGKMLVRV
jgi:NADPH-dependent curcumin reductase CurA